MIQPFGNYAKIEIIEEYAGIVRNDASEQQHKGILREFDLWPTHLTESGGFGIPHDEITVLSDDLTELIGQTVYYQEYADSGRKFEEDGKKYVMVPWYRIYGYEAKGEK
jgi:hypothetical protein